MGEPTQGERALWRELRWQAPGWHREYSTGRYRLDFYCPAARLAVELDGESHNGLQAWKRDQARDDWHAARGILTKRYSGYAVLGGHERDRVIREICELVRERAPEAMERPARRRFRWLVLTGRRPGPPVSVPVPRPAPEEPLRVRDPRLAEGIRRYGQYRR